MPNFTDALSEAVRGAACGLLGVEEGIQGWWARNTNLPFTDALAAGATAARRALCDNPTPVPSKPPEFTGGQCPGTQYTVTAQYTDGDGIGRSVARFGNGPVFGIVFGPDGFGRTRPFIQFADSQGVVGGTPLCSESSAGTCVRGETVRITSVVPNAGQPDDCGDPGFQPAPPINVDVDVPISITYVDNTNTEITELGDFNLALPIFLPGSITIPFTVDVGGVDITGNLDINGDITFEISPGRQPDDTVTDTPVPELPPGQEPVDEETERRIIGVHVFTTLPPNTSVTIISQDDGPDIFAPRGGSVRFLISGGSGASWTEDIDIKGSRQYIPCPALQGAISVVGNELPGGTVSLQRVFGAIPSYLIPE